MQKLNRNLYTNPGFIRESITGYACPDCASPLHTDSFERCERGASNHPEFDHTWLTLTFAAKLKCSNPRCGRIVHCVGKGYVDDEHEQNEDGTGWTQSYFDVFEPTFFEPPLVIFEVPDDCPAAVRLCLQDSFRVFFASPTGALNEARSAIELLLDEQHVPRKSSSGGRLSLAERIDWVAATPIVGKPISAFADHLDAIRALGNLGAHKEEVSAGEVIDCYQIIMYLLDKLYSNREAEAAAIARAVNALYPRSRRAPRM